MSRHCFDCEFRCNVRVRLGYEPAYDDRPAEFCLEVGWVGAGSDLGFPPFLYTSHDDPFHPGDDLDYCRDKLQKLGLVVPESLFDAVIEDARLGDGEREAQHFADGRIVEVPENEQ